MGNPTFESTFPQALAKAENLPSLPAVAVQVLRVCEDERSTVKDLARVVQRDPALAVKLLKLANSSLFSLGHPVATVDHAAMVLGMKTVKLMSLSFSLAERLPKEGASGFDYDGFWRRSLVAAVAGRALAKRNGKGLVDEAFLAGLLSHIGQLVLAECMPDLYLELFQDEAPRWPTLELEKGALGFHSADVAGALIRSWGLPGEISVPVAYAARPAEIPAAVLDEPHRLARLLAVALRVVSVVCDEDNGSALVRLEEEAERFAGLKPDRLEEFLLSLEREIRDTADMLAIELTEAESHASVIARARDNVVKLSLNATAALRTAERKASSLEVENRALAAKASLDALTGLHNRAALDAHVQREVERRCAGGVPRSLGLILLDVDHFKRLNDAHGHEAGDAVLAVLGEVVRRSTRTSDFAARYGGGEFAVVLPQTTPTFLRLVANRIREAIELQSVELEGKTLRVTVSVGAVCVSRLGSKHDAEKLIKVADRLLYRAKENGRNRVEVHTRTSVAPSTAEGE